MSELSVVSARPVRMRKRAEEGSKGAQTALDLADKPDKFLSTVQIGITLVGILTGVFGGASVASALAEKLVTVPVIGPYSSGISLLIVVGTITYFSIVVGELIPKSIALNSPEKVATLVSRPMKVISVLASPVVWLLSAPTSFILRRFKLHANVDPPVTDEEIKSLIDVGTKAGVFEETEQDLIESVIHLDDRRLASVMTPRTKMEWLDLEDSPAEIREQLTNTDYSRLPVCEGKLDAIIGYVSAKVLMKELLRGGEPNLREAVMQPLYVPETNTILDLLEKFKESHTHFAIVIDEFGGVEGVVTMDDVLSAFVGELSNSPHRIREGITSLPDGSFLMEGQTAIDEFKAATSITRELPGENLGQYHTLAGFVITHLGHLPARGERFKWSGLEFEIAEMQNNRIEKILVRVVENNN